MRQSFTREAARRLLHVSEKQLKSWEQQKLVLPAATYGFRELLALRTLIKLRNSRVPPQQIRRAIHALIKKLRGVEDPLTELKLYADGKRIRVELEGRAMEAESGQLLLNFDPGELSRLLEFRPKENPRAEREQRQAAEHWFQRGLDLEATGAPAPEIIEAYEKAIELDPASAGALVNLGTIHFNARNFTLAERYYIQATETDPEYAIEVSYEGSYELDEAVLADGSELDRHFSAMGGWIASTLVSLGDLKFSYLPPEDSTAG